MPSSQRSRLPGLLLNIIALATTSVSVAHAQTSSHTDDPIRLEDVVVSAARAPQDPRYIPSSVSFIKPTDLASSQIVDLRTALAAEPGVIVVASGATGGQTAVFMRGAGTDQVLLFVDGVRMNTTDAGYANFLGGADVVGIDRLEVLRGPQSTLYGSSAMGGVITMDTTHGCGQLSGVTAATLGSFGTFGGNVALQGGTRTFGYSASLSRTLTDNDRPENTYKQTSYSSRLELVALPGFLVGATLRGQTGKYQEAGSALSGGRGEIEAPNHLVTTYAQWSPTAAIRTRLTAAWHQTEYNWTDKTYGPASNYYTRNTRNIVDWQNSWLVAEKVQLVAGANAEWAHFTTGGNMLKDDQRGLYASVSVRPVGGLTLDLGGRTDDHDLEGRANTWRAGSAYYFHQTKTKLRATYGTGFKTPSMINRFGSPPWYGPSPTIKPEESKGWDAGIDQELFSGHLTASATYFHNDFHDLIASVYTFPQGKYIAQNVNKARTEGGEFALTAQPVSTMKFRASYTYLTALNNSNSAKTVRLTRRPRHSGDVELQVLPSSVCTLGAGLHFVGGREDTVFDPVTYASKQVDVENYVTARVFASWQASDKVLLKLRIENALNEKYSDAIGYSALSCGIFSSVEWKF